ncbi:hypothetical protein HPP92_014451 [Vanilla planifolia]|uniref:Uncharacterized protein n=1 Tax=Vanilla planifolia TaxID=51239 RepID=A0A835QHE3_VANPL|nr:hypothetical protein HPP92_014451 [Vanilla planifolia]
MVFGDAHVTSAPHNYSGGRGGRQGAGLGEHSSGRVAQVKYYGDKGEEAGAELNAGLARDGSNEAHFFSFSSNASSDFEVADLVDGHSLYACSINYHIDCWLSVVYASGTYRNYIQLLCWRRSWLKSFGHLPL